MDDYDYDTFCYSTRDLKLIRPLVEWPQHSLYNHNAFLSPDHATPRIKQEELGGFPSYLHHQQPRAYDAFNLPEQHTHNSPYSAILLPLHAEASISQQSRYYPTQSMQQHQQRRFFMRQQPQQQPAYHPQVYSESTLQPAWDDDRTSSLSSLVEMVDMDEMSAMIDVGGVVEDTVGDEDAEGEDEWEDLSQQPFHPQYITGEHVEDAEVDRSQLSDPDPVHSPSYTSDSSLSYTAIEGRSSRRRSQSVRYNPYATRSASSSSISVSNKRRSQTTSSPVTSSLPIPIPVPNLTKKSRGRRVPTMSSLEDIRSAASGAARKRQSVGGKSARMYLCEVEGCGKCFARGEHLKRHVRSIHTYEKREVSYLCFEAHIFTFFVHIAHRCPYPGCGKDFSRHDNLVQHLRVHKDYVPPRSPSSSSSLSSSSSSPTT